MNVKRSLHFRPKWYIPYIYQYGRRYSARFSYEVNLKRNIIPGQGGNIPQ